jgi:hypothetical protein
VLVELDLLREVVWAAVEVRKEVELVGAGLVDAWQRVDDRLRVNLLLDVNRHYGNGEVLAVLFVLALPDQLRIEGRIAHVEHGLGGVLVLGHEVA